MPGVYLFMYLFMYLFIRWALRGKSCEPTTSFALKCLSLMCCNPFTSPQLKINIFSSSCKVLLLLSQKCLLHERGPLELYIRHGSIRSSVPKGALRQNYRKWWRRNKLGNTIQQTQELFTCRSSESTNDHGER